MTKEEAIKKIGLLPIFNQQTANAEQRKEVVDLFAFMFPEKFRGMCPKCNNDVWYMYIKLVGFANQNQEITLMNTPKKFRFRFANKTAMYRWPFSGYVFTNANLTDETALWLLDQKPLLINQFKIDESIPEPDFMVNPFSGKMVSKETGEEFEESEDLSQFIGENEKEPQTTEPFTSELPTTQAGEETTQAPPTTAAPTSLLPTTTKKPTKVVNKPTTLPKETTAAPTTTAPETTTPETTEAPTTAAPSPVPSGLEGLLKTESQLNN